MNKSSVICHACEGLQVMRVVSIARYLGHEDQGVPTYRCAKCGRAWTPRLVCKKSHQLVETCQHHAKPIDFSGEAMPF